MTRLCALRSIVHAAARGLLALLIGGAAFAETTASCPPVAQAPTAETTTSCPPVAQALTAETTTSCPPVAQAPTAEQVQSGQRDARDRGFLWRITRDGRSSYLFGTVHVARPEWMYPGPRVAEAMHASDTFALELDLLDPEITRRLIAGLAAQPRTALPEPVRERLRRLAAAECVPAEALAGLSPEMQVLTLISLAGRRAGLDPAFGIDTFLSGWAHAQHKDVVSLETPELQLKALQMGSAQATVEFVERALDDLAPGSARDAMLRVAQVWADADLAALASYESWCECLKTAADRAVMARLLDDRNPALADGIAALHASGKRVFAAVGALHFTGPLGLPRLLEQRGYRVERVSYRR